MNRALILLSLAAVAGGTAGLAGRVAVGAEVDQVLVLYNKGWKRDAPGTQPGQDSEEIARYYVARHTDPKTGGKPYLLGLDLGGFAKEAFQLRGSLLKGDDLEERSRDNALGAVYRGKGRPLAPRVHRGDQPFYLLSTNVVCRVEAAKLDWNSVTLKVGSTDHPAGARTVFTNGASVRHQAVKASGLGSLPGKRFETSADRLGVDGRLHVWVLVKDVAGGVLRDERLDYSDFDNVEIPIPGRRLDWRTLTVDIWSPTSPSQRLRMCSEGRSRIGGHLQIVRDAKAGTGKLVFRAAKLGLRGDFMLGWSGRSEAGTEITGPQVRIRDARQIRIDVPDAKRLVDWTSVQIRFSSRADRSSAQPLYARGAPQRDHDVVRVDYNKHPDGRAARGVNVLYMNAWRAGFRGDVYVWLAARDRSGKTVLDHHARYFDPNDLAVSRTGHDGIRDDQNYLDLIEKPVRAFLEDPANAVDGQLLKDHVLYIVICHGLPLAVRRTYGLAQSAVQRDYTGSGPLVSLGQRLEMAYYDIEAVRPLRLVPVALGARYKSFPVWTAVSTWWFPLVGRQVQPYLHPAAYRRRPKDVQVPGPQPHFTSQMRRKFPRRFLFVCSRIDALDPLDAKALIDAAEYASMYLTPKIGSRPEGKWDGAKALAGTENKAAIRLLRDLGFPGVKGFETRLAWFGLRDDGSYYPGAVDYTVISGNGCDRPKSSVRRALQAGVTVTGGAARACRGCPHTTTHAWWDANVFYQFLFGGYDLGEAWLFSRYKCQWCTAFFGDPLYRPDLRKTRYDRTPPRIARPQDIAVAAETRAGKASAAFQAALQTSRRDPEMVRTVLEYWKKGQPQAPRTAVAVKFRKDPRLILSDLEPGTTYCYRLVLTDPYLNTFDSKKAFGALTFHTPPAKRD